MLLLVVKKKRCVSFSIEIHCDYRKANFAAAFRFALLINLCDIVLQQQNQLVHLQL